jgi:hypothetical protein
VVVEYLNLTETVIVDLLEHLQWLVQQQYLMVDLVDVHLVQVVEELNTQMLNLDHQQHLVDSVHRNTTVVEDVTQVAAEHKVLLGLNTKGL